MALKGWILPASTFDLPGGGDITVRGLSVDQVAALVREDQQALVAVFDRIMKRDDIKAMAEQVAEGDTPDVDVADLGMTDVASELLTTAPRLVAKIIAWAAHEPDAVDEAAQLPFPTQLEILVEIGRRTFETTAPGKFMETVIALTQSANTGLAAAQTVRAKR